MASSRIKQSFTAARVEIAIFNVFSDKRRGTKKGITERTCGKNIFRLPTLKLRRPRATGERFKVLFISDQFLRCTLSGGEVEVPAGGSGVQQTIQTCRRTEIIKCNRQTIRCHPRATPDNISRSLSQVIDIIITPHVEHGIDRHLRP